MIFAKVDCTPFMMVEKRLLVEVAILLLIMVEVATTPLVVLVKVFKADDKVLEFTKFAVVVATLPFTIEVRVSELVEVDTVSVFEVDEAIRLLRSVEVATPLMRVVRVVPEVKISFKEIKLKEVVVETPLMFEVREILFAPCVEVKLFEEIIDVVAITPLILVVRVLPERF